MVVSAFLQVEKGQRGAGLEEGFEEGAMLM